MNNTEREHIEEHILLRFTGELTPEQSVALDAVLARDAEAAAFARFVAESLPVRAPRDFAAAAIREAQPERKAISFPLRWKLASAAAAAAVVAAFAVVRFFPSGGPPVPPIALKVTSERVTADISARASALESELTAVRQQLALGRYHRTRHTL